MEVETNGLGRSKTQHLQAHQPTTAECKERKYEYNSPRRIHLNRLHKRKRSNRSGKDTYFAVLWYTKERNTNEWN